MTGLALEGNNLCRLLVSHGAVDSLLGLCNARDAELESSVTLTSAADSIAETIRDAVERTLRAAARAERLVEPRG